MLLTPALRSFGSESLHLRDLRKLQKHHIFSRKKHFLEPVSAETRVQAWPKSQRQGSWQPKSSISDVEAVCRGQVNNLRNREFQGEMKVQKHPEIYVSAGLSLGRDTRPQQVLAKKILTL